MGINLTMRTPLKMLKRRKKQNESKVELMMMKKLPNRLIHVNTQQTFVLFRR